MDNYSIPAEPDFYGGPVYACSVCSNWYQQAEFECMNTDADLVCKYCEAEDADKQATYKRIKLPKDYNRRRNAASARKEFMMEQDGLCAICGRKPRGRKLSLDHDHKTGFFRGLLCVNCNFMLSFACDDPYTLRSGAVYLERTLNGQQR